MYYHVKTAEYLQAYSVRVTFENGEVFDLDLKPFLTGDVFEPLKDIQFFKTVFVHPILKVLTWPNEADIAPETLYAYAKGKHKFTA